MMSPVSVKAQDMPELDLLTTPNTSAVPVEAAPQTPSTTPPIPTTPAATGDMQKQVSLSPQDAPVARPLSVGTFGSSIMYLPEDFANMIRILQAYEGSQTGPNLADTSFSDDDILSQILDDAGETAAEEVEIVPFPDYYVSSIVYRGPGNWAVWVNGESYTSRKPAGEAEPLTIAGISREQVTLNWKPDNPQRASELWEATKANPDKAFRHRSAKQVSIDYDNKANSFLVTMQPNQTFSPEKMDIMEGSIMPQAAPAVPVADLQAVPDAVMEEAEVEAPGTLSPTEREIADELFSTIMKMQKIIPMSNPNQPVVHPSVQE